MTGLGLGAAGIFVALAVDIRAVPPIFTAAGWAITGAGMGLTYPIVSLIVLSGAPTDGAGLASASLQLANVIGGALGAGVGGLVLAGGDSMAWSASGSMAVIFVVMLAVSAMALVASRGLPSTPAIS